MKSLSPETLWEYALGRLAAGEREALEAQLAASDEARTRLQECMDMLRTLDGPPRTNGAAIRPGAGARNRLMDSVRGEPLEPLMTRVASFIDLPLQRTRDIVAMLKRPEAFKGSVLPGLLQWDFVPGPALGQVIEIGLVKLPAGFRFPRHRHGGEERVMVLQGSFVDDVSGQVLVPGDVGVMKQGSEHSFHVPETGECVLMAMLFGPLLFD